MSVSLYITHPQVRIDPAVPVPQWGLSEAGRSRAEVFAGRGLFSAGSVFVASTETKAVELAHVLAEPHRCDVVTDAALGENDRSATGFLAPDAFEDMANRFFANPDVGVEGWERAIDAQARVVGAVARQAAVHGGRPIVFCGHGAVGTLLKCHIAGRRIARSEDQPGGGGNVFAFDLALRTLLCEWTPMEKWMGFDQ